MKLENTIAVITGGAQGIGAAIAGLRPTAIYHCAGAPHVGDSWSDTVRPLSSNALATHHLLDALPRETHAYVAEMLRENLGVAYVVDSDFAFLNRRLATLYGIEGVEGTEIRKVKLPAGHVRGGLLTQAAVLKVTANGTTTSPILRGSWVLERILGTPPPKPTVDVEAVEQALRPEDPHAHAGRGPIPAGQDLVQRRDARALVADPDHQHLGRRVPLDRELRATAARVAQGIARDLRRRRGDTGLSLRVEAQPRRQLARRRRQDTSRQVRGRDHGVGVEDELQLVAELEEPGVREGVVGLEGARDHDARPRQRAVMALHQAADDGCLAPRPKEAVAGGFAIALDGADLGDDAGAPDQ